MDYIKVQAHHYKLQPLGSLNACSNNMWRSGALLKVIYRDGLVGYSDCHPWVEFNDIQLEDQLKSIKATPSSLIERSLFYARVDAEGRAYHCHLLESLAIPLSHYLCINLQNLTIQKIKDVQQQGYTSIKIKIGRDPDSESNRLLHLSPYLCENNLKLRMDCNESLSKEEYHRFIDSLVPLHPFIEFVEDPYPFDPISWEQTRSLTHVPLACDHKLVKAMGCPDSYDYLIWKPVVQKLPKVPKNKRLVVTSYFDHPFGQVIAAYEAARNCSDQLCGLQTHLHYQSNPFMENLSIDSPTFLKKVKGTGFGFDELLEKLEWTDVCI